MTSNTAVTRYNSISIALHWAVAILIIGLIILGWYMAGLPRDAFRSTLYNLHKSFGAIVLGLILLRIIWRLRSVLPSQEVGHLQQVLIEFAHFGLYLLMFAVPFIALVAGSFNRGYTFFQWHWEPLFAKDPDLAHFFMDWHGWLAYALTALVAGHILAALHHQFVVKDNIFRRIWFS